MPLTNRWTEKDPNEVCSVSLDFAPALATGESVASATAAVFTNTTPPVASADITVQATGIAGTICSARIYGGVSGTDYLITLTATTSNSNVIPRTAKLFVGPTS